MQRNNIRQREIEAARTHLAYVLCNALTFKLGENHSTVTDAIHALWEALEK